MLRIDCIYVDRDLTQKVEVFYQKGDTFPFTIMASHQMGNGEWVAIMTTRDLTLSDAVRTRDWALGLWD